MSPRSLWNIILKTFGIYFIFQLLYVLREFITLAAEFFGSNSYQVPGIAFLISFLFVAFFLYVLYLMMFKTGWLVDKLRLTKGIDEEKLELNVDSPVMLRIIVVVIGFLMFVEGLPLFLQQLDQCFNQVSDNTLLTKTPSFWYMVFHFLTVLIGYLMVTASRPIVNFIEKQRKDKITSA